MTILAASIPDVERFSQATARDLHPGLMRRCA
jgi:hypothetical protein